MGVFKTLLKSATGSVPFPSPHQTIRSPHPAFIKNVNLKENTSDFCEKLMVAKPHLNLIQNYKENFLKSREFVIKN